MRIRLILAGVAAAGLMAFPAMAQDGQYAPQLTRIIAEAAEGTCLAAYMAPSLLDACNGQIAGMSPVLRAMGAIETMNWVIGQERDGKFSVVGAGG